MSAFGRIQEWIFLRYIYGLTVNDYDYDNLNNNLKMIKRGFISTIKHNNGIGKFITKICCY